MQLNRTDILLVGTGSCLGGIARYAVSRVLHGAAAFSFPWGTFVVNVAGCLIIGVIYGMLDRGFQLSSAMKLFLTVGFCGGFTTFSTFVHENYQLLQTSHILLTAVYIALSIACGILAVYVGYRLVHSL